MQYAAIRYKLETMSNKTKKVAAKSVCSIKDIVDEGLLEPYRRSIPGVRKLVIADRHDKNVLSATIAGAGTNTRYFIKRANIKKLRERMDKGTYMPSY